MTRRGALASTLLSATVTLVGQDVDAAPRIDHVGLECIEPGTFAVVLSGIAPDSDIQTAKVYFRSSLYPDFYYVVMTREADRFVGILPQPTSETPAVVYYVEAVDQVFESARSPEFAPPVEDPCDDRSGVAYLPGEPGITVGAVSAGAAPLPPGFSAVGIVGTITALGVSSGVGGGIGAGTAVAVAAGAAAGVTGAVVVTQNEETTSSSVSATTTSVVAVTTSTVSSSPTTTTASPTTSVPSSTSTSTSSTTSTVPGPSSTTTSAPPTTTIPPTTTAPPTTSVPTTTTVPPTTTTVPPTTTVAPSVTACFNYVGKQNSCVHRWNASCSTGPITSYEWRVDTTGQLPAGTLTFNNTGPDLVVDWNPIGSCSGSPTIAVELTVRDALNNTDSTVQSGFRIDLRGPEPSTRLRTEFTSELLSDSSTVSATVSLGGARADGVYGAGPYVHRVEGSEGRHYVDAAIVSGLGSEALWRFDFSRSEHFVAGSLRPERGQVVSATDRVVVFRVTREAGGRVRFWYQLSR